MKITFAALFITVLSVNSYHQRPVDLWVQEIIETMIDFEDLSAYSDQEIPEDVEVNLLWVEAVKDVKIEDGIISMLVAHKEDTYCSQLKFKYIEKNGEFFLSFGETSVTKVLSSEKTFIDPWIEHKKLCP